MARRERARVWSSVVLVSCVSVATRAVPIETPDRATDADVRAIFSLAPADLAMLHATGVTNEQLVLMGPAPVAKTVRKINAQAHGESKPDQPDEAMRWRYRQRAGADGTIPREALMRAKSDRDKMVARRAATEGAAEPLTDWEWMGPGNIGGRTRSILINPENPSVMYAGAVGGGVWKSINAGVSWAPLNDFLTAISVASMAMDPNDPDTIYVGTGEGFFNGDAIVGAGIFRSTDGGATFEQLPATDTSEFDFVNRIAFEPGSSTTMLVATNEGVFRSTNAGATFALVRNGRTLDVDFARSEPSIAVAGTNGFALWSADGGQTWSTATLAGVSGNPRRIEVAIAPSDPSIVYASSQEFGLFRSTDGGRTYTLVASQFYMGTQGWYDNVIWVDPTDPNTVVVGGIDLHRTRDGGATWAKISAWQFAPVSAHADHHMIVEHPGFDGVTNRTVFFGNDGGLYRANNVYTVAELSGWQALNNNYGVTQFYGGAGNANGRLFGGTQDNGSLTMVGGVNTWTTMFGGDGGYSAADLQQFNFVYGETQWGRIHRSSNSGASSSFIHSPGLLDAQPGATNFITPFILDPNGYSRLYVGADRLWRSPDARFENGAGWTIVKASAGPNHSAVAVAPGNPNLLWVGHNDGQVFRTTNGLEASPAWIRLDGTTLPNRFVTSIAIDPVDNNIVWMTFSGFATPNVWRTTDGGATWQARSGTIPDQLPALPVNSVTLDPFVEDRVFIGTDLGVFVSTDDGATWTTNNIGPANTVVDQVFTATLSGDQFVVAATHGRGMYRMPLIAPIPGEITGDGAVNAVDLAVLINSWGPCAPDDPCPADLNDDGIVNGIDLAIILTNWTG